MVNTQTFQCHLGQGSRKDKSSKFYIDINLRQDDLFQNVIKACLAHVYIVIKIVKARSVIKKHMNVEHV